MQHPYQLTRICKSSHFGKAGLLLAACGPKIVSVTLNDGLIVSQWPSSDETFTVQENVNQDDEGPPGKKRKTEPNASRPPNIIQLAVSSNEQYAVAVTGDDKCVRVFEIVQSGELVELSQRCMPKRPCAILVTPDNKTIICGDKFGDVYSLPLLQEANGTSPAAVRSETTPDSARPKTFTPAATNLTVHTARNRKALEAQLKQKDLGKTKEPLRFEHDVLLGHVSMLTDVKFVTHDEQDGKRDLIITSDRDEHIRISRGPPQAHIIERYCLGHDEFISKLCAISDQNTLVSGGGDDWLGFWDLHSGRLRKRCDLKAALTVAKHGATSEGSTSIAVTGIWAIPCGSAARTALLVATESRPALVVTALRAGADEPSPVSVVDLPGNILDMAFINSTVMVSMDVPEGTSPRLQAYTIDITDDHVTLESDRDFDARLDKINGLTTSATRSDELLYSVENLRKRGMEDSEETA